MFKFKELIGFIIGNHIVIENESEYEIFFIYVGNKYRRSGFGSLLVNAISNFKITKSLKKISLEVSKSNDLAINFYKKNGFKTIGTRKNYYNEGLGMKEDAIIFEKIDE